MVSLFFLLFYSSLPPLLSRPVLISAGARVASRSWYRFQGWTGRGKFSNVVILDVWKMAPSPLPSSLRPPYPPSLSPTPFQVFTCHWLARRFPWRGPRSRQSSCFPRSREAWRPACTGRSYDTPPGTTRPSPWRLQGCRHAGSPTPLCRSMQERKAH